MNKMKYSKYWKFVLIFGIEQVNNAFDDLHWPSASEASQLLGKIDPTPLIAFHAACVGHYVLVFSSAIILMVCVEQPTTLP
ncbi:hypothetical protein K0M31_000448 [Melipona bicolor]|uniref:Uncharacterized protein n=1 Tax=Melipona bicolor TaxID=60889 RepID=A0AA40KWR1_9HYME|nr:hypothetical protein K0M31_000448 [Melipona bicolor]